MHGSIIGGLLSSYTGGLAGSTNQAPGVSMFAQDAPNPTSTGGPSDDIPVMTPFTADNPDDWTLQDAAKHSASQQFGDQNAKSDNPDTDWSKVAIDGFDQGGLRGSGRALIGAGVKSLFGGSKKAEDTDDSDMD